MQINIRNQVAGIMTHLCVCPKHGYTQGAGRMGGSEKEAIVVDGVDWLIGAGDYDCSGSIISVWDLVLNRYFGFETQNCTYTGNMRSGFTNTGLFEWHPMSDGFIAQPGDIYLNEAQHTAMCITAVPDVLGEFYINEFGGITGGQLGDQTGNESRLHAYYDFPWDGILHYTGQETIETEDDDEMGTYAQTAAEQLTRADDPTGVYTGGNMFTRVAYMDARLRDVQVALDGLTATDMSGVQDETGEYVNSGVNMNYRLAYCEAWLKKMMEQLERIEEKIGDVKCCK